MSTTADPIQPSEVKGSGCAARAVQGVLVLFLVIGTIGYTIMAISGNPSVTPLKLALGPGLAGFVVTWLPGSHQKGLWRRIGFAMLVMGTAFVAMQAMFMIARIAPDTSERLHGVLAGPSEEGVKLLAMLLLAQASSWGNGHPKRMVILAVAVAIAFAGIENIGYLSAYTPRVLFNRSLSVVGHVTCTGIAVSGFAIAQFTSGFRRYLIPIVTFCLGAGIHAFSNRFTRTIHGNLLAHVDPLPEVMTREQWFGAPHYDELWLLVAGGFAVVWISVFVLLLIRIHRLAQTREAHP